MRSFALIAALCALTACATPSVPLTGSGPAAKGGGTETDQPVVDTTFGIAYPGATQVSSPVDNNDTVANSNAAPAFVFDLSGRAAHREDVLVKSLEAEIAVLLPKSLEAGDPGAAALARLEQARARLAARLGELDASSKEANLPNLRAAIFNVFYPQQAGADVQKLTADAIRAAGETMAKALGPATEAAKK